MKVQDLAYNIYSNTFAICVLYALCDINIKNFKSLSDNEKDLCMLKKLFEIKNKKIKVNTLKNYQFIRFSNGVVNYYNLYKSDIPIYSSLDQKSISELFLKKTY